MQVNSHNRFKHYLYVIGEGCDVYCRCYEGYIKVGISNNPKNRLKDLQCANPRSLKFLLVLGLRNKYQADFFECGVHAKMSNHLVKNEWFAYNQYTDNWIKKLSKCFPNVTEEWQ